MFDEFLKENDKNAVDAIKMYGDKNNSIYHVHTYVHQVFFNEFSYLNLELKMKPRRNWRKCLTLKKLMPK